mgnify:CR=1 FL=1
MAISTNGTVIARLAGGNLKSLVVLMSMGIFALLKGTTLALIFAAFISFSATQMFLDKKPKPGPYESGSKIYLVKHIFLQC